MEKSNKYTNIKFKFFYSSGLRKEKLFLIVHTNCIHPCK